MQQTTIYFMRHAPTFWNREHRLQGGVDTDIITETVHEHFVTKNLSILTKPDHIIVSALRRTHQTATALQQHMRWGDIPLQREVLLNERAWGLLEGKTHEDALSFLSQKSSFSYIQTIDHMRQWWDSDAFSLEGAESISDVRKRAEQAVENLLNEHGGKKLLVVTHAGVLISLGLDHAKISQCVYTK